MKEQSAALVALGPWFEAQGMTRLEQVADYILSLQRNVSDLLRENERLRQEVKAKLVAEDRCGLVFSVTSQAYAETARGAGKGEG